MIGKIIKMRQNTIEEEKLFVQPDPEKLGGVATVKLDSGETVGAQCSYEQLKRHKIGDRVIVRLFGPMFSL